MCFSCSAVIRPIALGIIFAVFSLLNFVTERMGIWSCNTFKRFIFNSCHQVWSLTQFISVDFWQSRIDVKKCVFNKRTIKVCVSCCWWCPGTSAPSAAHLSVSLHLSSNDEASRGPLKGAVSAQKALQGSKAETREFLGGTEENSVSPMRGHWFALQANQFFSQKGNRK